MEPLTQRTAEGRSLALHREAVRRLRDRPELVSVARARVEGWRHAEIASRIRRDARGEVP